MELRLTVAAPDAPGPPVDVAVTAAPGTALAEALPAVLDAVGADRAARLFAGDAPVHGALTLGVPPLLDGAVLTVGRPACAPGARTARARALLELHVTAGPDAGHVHPLPPGRHRIGRSPTAEVRLADPDASRVHAVVEVSPRGVTVHDADSTNGTRLDGEHVTQEPVVVGAGARLGVGSSTVTLRLPEQSVAATAVTGDGTLEVNRAPRTVAGAPSVTVRMPAEPAPVEPAPFPLLAMLLPLAVSVPMALLWSPFALLLGLTTPVMVLGNLVSDRRSGRRRHGDAVREYAQRRRRAQEQVDAALTAERLHRHACAPDAAAVWRIAGTPSTRLWERRPGDPDDLLLRVGSGTVTSRVTVVRPGTAGEPQPTSRPELDDVPLTVSLARHGVVGVCGPRARTVGLARFLVCQVAVLQSPLDVALVVLGDGEDDAWSWVRWLPHARAGGDGKAAVAHLMTLLDARRSTPGAPGADVAAPGPRIVVVIDGARRLRGVPGVATLLRDGPAHGIHLLCLDEDPGSLPAECTATVEITGEVGTRLRVVSDTDDDRPVPKVQAVADLVSPGWTERVARALAPLRDATPVPGSAGVPRRVGLLELLPEAVRPLDPAALAAGWRRRPRSTRVVLGVGRDGVYAPDLRLDGPHVLVGGTTGSGKSELLQTLIASLAVANRPDELAFVLVDYKGGAAFAECHGLPHTLGVVTDLDEHLTRRALTSLAAEVRRREGVLRVAGAKDIEEYQSRLDDGHAGQRLPRLVIVVDEFRVLAEELPDFVTGLVRLAAVGRSLGLHLVLATQRPGGVIGPDIAANVNLRIALRVRDRVDSTDVVDAPDAATIDPSVPGRAMARTGSGPLIEFQTARVGGGTAPLQAPRVTVRRDPWRPAGAPPPGTAPNGILAPGPTDLARLVASLRDAAALASAQHHPSPWLPPLPDRVTAAAARESGVASTSMTGLVVGLVDEPEMMSQRPWVLDPDADGALLVVGTARSGRTGVLAAVVAASAAVSPARLHLYVVAGSDAGLRGAERLPHTGAVVPGSQPDRIASLLRRLAAEVARRRGGPVAGPPPRILLLLDGWESVRRDLEDAVHGQPVEDLLRVLREGPAVGVLTVLAGDRQLLTGRLAAAAPDRLVLRPADPTDAVLAGARVSDLPHRMPPGRGLLVGASGVREVQVAAAPDLDDVAARASWDVAPADLPFRVDELPERVDAAALPGWPIRAGQRASVPAVVVGVGGEDVAPVGFPLAEARALVVAGPAGSGRSTALAALAQGLLRAGTPVVVVCPRPSPLRGGVPGAAAVLGADDAGELARLTGNGAAPVVLVDDADAVEGTAVEEELLRHLAAASDRGGGVVLAGAPADLGTRLRGLAAEVRRARTGILLSPTGYADGDVLGVAVPRVAGVRPGRGHLVRAGSVEALQVALPAPGMLAP